MSKINQNPEITALIAKIKAFRATHGMTKTGFGLWTVKDPNLIRDLENGRELRWSTIQAIQAKMHEKADAA